MANSFSKPVITLDTIPTEIRLKIFKYALSTDEIIDVTVSSHDRVKAKPNPVLGLGLLRTCHRYYHEGRPLLYTDKIQLFGRYGSELHHWTRPLGIPRCKDLGCDVAQVMPVLERVILAMGHRSHCSHGETSMIGFDGTLKHLYSKGGIRIKHLQLLFEDYSFCLTYKPFMLADALRGIKGVLDLEIVGYLEEEEADQFCIALFGKGCYIMIRNPFWGDVYNAINTTDPDSLTGTLANGPVHTPFDLPLNLPRLFVGPLVFRR